MEPKENKTEEHEPEDNKSEENESEEIELVGNMDTALGARLSIYTKCNFPPAIFFPGRTGDAARGKTEPAYTVLYSRRTPWSRLRRKVC